MKRIVFTTCLMLIAAPLLSAGVSLEMPRFFSSNMVLQRDAVIPIWGNAAPGATITIELAGDMTSTIANARGQWRAELPQLQAGGPYVVSVRSADTTAVFTNVLIGDVWIASGQSNMQWRVDNSNDAENEIANANYPNLRLFTVPRSVSGFPKSDVNDGVWLECTPETVPSFSAVAYFFGRELHLEKNVPIGLIHTSWGGTPAEAWTSAGMLKTMPAYKDAAETLLLERPDYELMDTAQEPLREQYNELINKANEGFKKGVHKRKYDDTAWKQMPIPGFWEQDSLLGYDGFVWYRKAITLPPEMVGKDLQLHLGRIRQSDITYFNGAEIGNQGGDQKYRVYDIPAEKTRDGENVIAVRITNRWGNGGFIGPADSLYINQVGVRSPVLSLVGDWKYDESSEPELPHIVGFQNKPAALYNAMIAPLIPFGMTGAIWYQGESNASRAFQYRTLFPKMIEDWRVRWGQGYFPFLFVQLANFTQVLPQPAESDWAELREAQLMTLDYPNTGMAVTIDIGEADDIHPRNKQDVGKRLALAARHIAYGEDVVYSGPMYESMNIDEDRIILHFNHVGSGLMAKGDNLQGFAIAGADRKFVWADATIQGDQVIVSSPLVQEPVAVRYAWANNPICNLFNKEGLPASPFRTDDWPGITAPDKH